MREKGGKRERERVGVSVVCVCCDVCVHMCVCLCVYMCVWQLEGCPTHFASSARAMTPAAMGAEALVPVNELMQ